MPPHALGQNVVPGRVVAGPAQVISVLLNGAVPKVPDAVVELVAVKVSSDKPRRLGPVEREADQTVHPEDAGDSGAGIMEGHLQVVPADGLRKVPALLLVRPTPNAAGVAD